MKGIALVGVIDERHTLHADVPPELPPGRVRVIVLWSDEEEDDEAGRAWGQGVAKEWARELEEPGEDLYTVEDGEPLVNPQKEPRFAGRPDVDGCRSASE